MEELRNAYRRTAFMGAVMLVSIFGYAAVAVVLQFAGGPFGGLTPGGPAALLRNALLVVALGAVVAAHLIRNRLLSTVRHGGGSAADSEPIEDRIQRLATGFIVVFALAEAVAIFGLIVFLLYGNLMDFFVFWLISLVSFALIFPRYSRWEEWLKQNGPRV